MTRAKVRCKNADNLLHFFVISVQLISHLARNSNGLHVARNICAPLSSHIGGKISSAGSRAYSLDTLVKRFSKADVAEAGGPAFTISAHGRDSDSLKLRDAPC
ncbi:hypothetical protein D3C80_1244810 [compost metagenome]